MFTFTRKKLAHLLLSILILGIGVPAFSGMAQAVVIFSTEEGTTNADTFVIDNDDSSTGDINLDFGTTGSKASLIFDTIADEFKVNKDINFDGNEAQNIVIHTGTAFPTAVEGKMFYRSDLDSLYVNTDGTAGGWIAITSGSGSDATTLDGLDSGDFLRSNVADSYTGTGTLTFGSGTTLDIDTGSTLDAESGTVKLDGITNNTLTLDDDGTGGDVTIVFGTTLSESIFWDDSESEFFVSDDLKVSGALETTGGATFGGAVDFNQNEADELVLDKGTAFPTSPAPVAGQKFFRTDLSLEYVYDGASWVANMSTTGSGKTIQFAPIYEDATLFADGSDNRGTMSSDFDSSADRNYYEWASRRGTLQDYDIVLQVRVPDDFLEWQETPMTLAYRTGSGATTSEAQIDVTVQDTSGTAITTTGGADLLSTSWATASIAGSGWDAGTFTAGSYMNVFLKLHSRRVTGTTYSSFAGEIELNYYTN